MADCCEDKACAIEALRERQSATLKVVLAINIVMFAVELASGLLARSTALMSDALVALFKGSLILLAGLFVLGQVAYRLVVPASPLFEAMGAIGFLALAANSVCLWLLWKHRREDVNMSSVWECSRNDIASNLAVLCAAAAVWLADSRWPDLVVGALLAILFLRSAVRVLGEAWRARAIEFGT